MHIGGVGEAGVGGVGGVGRPAEPLAYPPAVPPATRNDVSGTVHGPVVQAGQMYGNVTIAYQLPPLPGAHEIPDDVPPTRVRVIDRAEQVAALDGSLAGEGAGPVPVWVLTGMPGVGKTTLACHWAERSHAGGLFRDGQLYVDFAALRDRAGGVGGAVSDAVAMCLRALGVPETGIPAAFHERVARYRRCSARRQILVVVENVTQPAQVTELIPKGPGSALLATSGGRIGDLSLSSVQFLPLEPLEVADGVALLADVCRADRTAAQRSAAERVVRLCGGLPVALRIVAARLAAHRHLSLARLAEELADESSRLDGMSLEPLGGEQSVSAAFSVAYRDLPPDAARMYRLLGLLPMTVFDVGIAAVAANTDVATGGRLLNVLRKAGLVSTTNDERYRFHDLVALHARQRAEEEEPVTEATSLTKRVAEHFLALTALADRAVRDDRLRIAILDPLLRDAPNPFGRKARALAWLEAERSTIMAVLRAASRHGLHALVWPLAEGFTALFLHHRHLSDWRESLELGVAAAIADGRPAAEARLRSLLSRPLMDLGAYGLAREHLEAAVAAASTVDHLVLRASVQEFFGRYWDRFDPVRAIEAYRESRSLNVQAREPRGAAIATYFLGRALAAAGDHEAGLATLRQARAELLALDSPDRRMAARAQADIGGAHEQLGDPDAARGALRQAVDELADQGATHYEAQARVRLAHLLRAAGGDQQAARDHLTKALDSYEQGGSPEADTVRQLLEDL